MIHEGIFAILNEARGPKPFFGNDGSFNYAVNIEGLDNNDFPTKSFGHQIKDLKLAISFKELSKSTSVACKGKSTLPQVRKWVKENKPTEFYAKWQKDSPSFKDDSVEIFYRG